MNMHVFLFFCICVHLFFDEIEFTYQKIHPLKVYTARVVLYLQSCAPTTTI